MRYLVITTALVVVATSAQAQVKPGSWEEAYPVAKRHCEEYNPDSFSMRAMCMESQKKGWEKLKRENDSMPPSQR